MYLRNAKSNLFNFCDGQIICVSSSVKSVFILVLLCVLFICVCVLRCAQSPAGEDVLTVLFELFEVLSFGKTEITLLLTFFFFQFKSAVSEDILARAKIAATLLEQPFELIRPCGDDC